MQESQLSAEQQAWTATSAKGAARCTTRWHLARGPRLPVGVVKKAHMLAIESSKAHKKR